MTFNIISAPSIVFQVYYYENATSINNLYYYFVNYLVNLSAVDFYSVLDGAVSIKDTRLRESDCNNKMRYRNCERFYLNSFFGLLEILLHCLFV